MKISLLPLYSQLNPGPGHCPLGCSSYGAATLTVSCLADEKAPQLKQDPAHRCPLSSHQAETCAQISHGSADIVFNSSATGDGKSLASSLPALLNPDFRIMGLYPTIELVEDQTQQQHRYHSLFNLEAKERVDCLFGAELSRRVSAAKSNKFQELLLAIQTKPVILTNPDIFHLICHFKYRDPAYGSDLLPVMLAGWPDLWVFDEFHIFGPHQEAAALNSLTLIRRTQQQPKRFLFTSATPKPDFIEQLRQADYQVAEVRGVYASAPAPGFRPILQPVELEFVELKDTDSLSWLTSQAHEIREILFAETQGRGLIILNSVALAGRAVRELQTLLPEVMVREVSGRIDRQERALTQAALKNAPQPVLVVGTSAVDVGVDFRIHLLIFEGSDSATVVQRLGRLGRHPGFSAYRAFILLPARTPWIGSRLREKLEPEQVCDRNQLQEAIVHAFEPPQNFQEYFNCWGALQAQGMFWQMSEGNAAVMQPVRERMASDLQKVYGKKLESAQKRWFALGKDTREPVATRNAIHDQLLRFRGDSSLQAAVWEGNRFYLYDLLRLLPYARVEIIERERFLSEATAAGHAEEAFPERHTHVYLQLREWVDRRFELSLHCNLNSNELEPCQLSLISRLSIAGHPQAEVKTCLRQKKLLAFLVPVSRDRLNRHWDVSRTLHLNPLFGLYRLTDGAGKAYACAFNQDALLLEAMKWKLKKFCQSQPKSLIF
ncbi:type I-D CRISPR-associated helicase Cas3' [Kamptonema formosum]|uniref:type I-D CRISPR-associated helicase Cas3' n=1 Tax=Kamptonema formosum TaxID=331992 RepID=UPI00034D3E37|nr:type I-D CRISPR-associated helicase Cas3' [Oscillatoria sp. PCC 10802]